MVLNLLLEEAKTAVTALPPGPWVAYGNKVYAGSRVVAGVSPGPKAEETARMLARLPDLVRLLTVAAPDTLIGRVKQLEEQVEKLEDEVIDLKIELEHKVNRFDPCAENH